MGLDLLASLDRSVLDAVQSVHTAWLDLLGSVVTIAGQSEVLAPLALAVAIVRLRARRRDWWGPLLIVAVVVIEIVLKIVVTQAPPPPELSRGVDVLPFLDSPTKYAFPSGHVARLAFVATALRWPRVLSIVAVAVMGLSRVYLGQHWPSDVIGGCALGYFVGKIAQRA